MKRYSLSFDDEDFENLTIGILKLNLSYSDHEFFYALNQQNTYQFRRMKDLVIEGQFYTYYHSVFKGYHNESKTFITFISNTSYHSIQKEIINELFTDEQKINYLLKNNTFNGFLIRTQPLTNDFSLILFSEKLPSIEIIQLKPSEDIYHLIESYE